MPKDPYIHFAELYDSEMKSRETTSLYEEWREALQKAAKKYNVKIHTLIDLACGTGNTTIPWVKKGYKVIGVDLSPSMLRTARKKSKKVKWVRQDLVKLNLKEKAEAITCHYDALDHILSKSDLQKVFKKVHAHLQDGGLFSFDMNTEHWFKWLKSREKLFTVGDNYFMASNKYNPKTKIAEFRQLWFVKNGRHYKKIDVRVKERSYKKQEIQQMLKKAGFRLLSAKPQRILEGKPIRMLYLAQKKNS